VLVRGGGGGAETEPAGLLDNGPDQRGLADAGFAAQHEQRGLPAPHRAQCLQRRTEFGGPAPQRSATR
jgi:hypothetical protein